LTPWGSMTVDVEDGQLVTLGFKSGLERKVVDSLAVEVEKQVSEYFDGKRKSFDLPLNLKGTTFQRAVWMSCAKIEFGQTKTYKQIAGDIDNPDSQRACGQALTKNPIPIIIPCHRVVASNGLGGFGLGTLMKIKLLTLEKTQIFSNPH